ncbi:hypothetical protein [Pseudolabrys sp. Root1462]|uniref:hypothetical protein n=1 Tax=Pseudolabrys sp. Root1462 TaxID=1736466 RepID=UPI0012E337F9|nr:hypothetical protein [Pseudolabrys sp. Root1462]
MSNVVELQVEPRHAPARQAFLSPHQMLCALFADRTPVMSFLKNIYRSYGIITVQQWDRVGGGHLFDEFNLSAAGRRQFNERVGSPHRPASMSEGRVVALRR